MKKIIFFSILLISSCSKESGDAVKPGCKPSVIDIQESFSGSYEEQFNYLDDKLTKVGIYDYEYDGNNVGRILRGSVRFEEYTYSNDNVVTSSKQFRKESDVEDFVLAEHYKYEYSNGQVVKLINQLNNDEFVFHRNEQTSNIDSLVKYDSNNEILKSEYYTYDDNPNIYLNDCTPKFGYHNWITKTTRNNILTYKRIKPNTEDIFYNVNMTYNQHDYPELVVIDFSSGSRGVKEITYTNCD